MSQATRRQPSEVPPRSGLRRITQVRLDSGRDSHVVEVHTSDRSNLPGVVEEIAGKHALVVERWEVLLRSDTVVDRFHLNAKPKRWLDMQVSLIEALDPDLRWVASELIPPPPSEVGFELD